MALALVGAAVVAEAIVIVASYGVERSSGWIATRTRLTAAVRAARRV